jgi:transcriptional regulator with XRE-family HTH domain
MTRPGRRRRADSRYAEQAAQLAAWLRDRREQAGLSQEQLAARAQVAVATVRKIETGAVIEPGYFTVLALVQALGGRREDVPALWGSRCPRWRDISWRRGHDPRAYGQALIAAVLAEAARRYPGVPVETTRQRFFPLPFAAAVRWLVRASM